MVCLLPTGSSRLVNSGTLAGQNSEPRIGLQGRWARIMGGHDFWSEEIPWNSRESGVEGALMKLADGVFELRL